MSSRLDAFVIRVPIRDPSAGDPQKDLHRDLQKDLKKSKKPSMPSSITPMKNSNANEAQKRQTLDNLQLQSQVYRDEIQSLKRQIENLRLERRKLSEEMIPLVKRRRSHFQ